MRRLPFILLAFCALGAFTAPAHAAVPCWKKVVNDWYGDGKIASTYAPHCYNQAYSHLKTDELVYSSLGDDIHRALAAAVARNAGKKVPSQVGKGFAPERTSLASASVPEHRSTKTKPTGATAGRTAADLRNGADTTAAAAPVASTNPASSSTSSGVPVPLLVLGGVAVSLIAVGSVGAVVRRRRSA